MEIREGVETIGARGFVGCTSLKGVIIPKSVKTIGQAAFESCTSLERVIIPKSVKTVERGDFSGCTSLEKEISEKIGLNVSIKNNRKNNGSITFTYSDIEQLNKIIEIIKKNY